MSWEREKRTKVCPCGKGLVQWDHEEDDYCRIRDVGFMIACSDCSKKYRIQTFSFSDNKESWTAVYCVPISLHLDPEPSLPRYDDFKHYLIFNYFLESLVRMSSSLDSYTSFASIPKSEFSLCRAIYYCGKYDGTKRLTYVRDVLQSAIADYGSEESNYEKHQVRLNMYCNDRAAVLKQSYRVV